MAVPTTGYLQPVVPAECNGNQANVKQDGEAVLTPGVNVRDPATGLMMEGWYEEGQEARVLRTDVNGALIVTGTLTVTPGVAVENQNEVDPFDNVTPVGFTVTPLIDYEFEYVTMHFSGLTASASITVQVYYQFTNAAYNTLVYEKTFNADGSGVADFFYTCKTFRKANSPIRIVATTTSVAATGQANTTVATTQ